MGCPRLTDRVVLSSRQDCTAARMLPMPIQNEASIILGTPRPKNTSKMSDVKHTGAGVV